MLIKDKPSHGYELIKMIEQRTFGRWRPSHSAIYNILNKLTEKGYIKLEEIGKREKKIYKLTEKGDKLVNLARNEVKTLIDSLIQTLIREDIEHEIPLPAIDFILNEDITSILEGYSKEEIKKVLSKFKKTLETKLKGIDELLEKIGD